MVSGPLSIMTGFAQLFRAKRWLYIQDKCAPPPSVGYSTTLIGDYYMSSNNIRPHTQPTYIYVYRALQSKDKYSVYECPNAPQTATFRAQLLMDKSASSIKQHFVKMSETKNLSAKSEQG
ncbi:MAG: hypothetical protein LBP35_00145 [Candidatus Ancillula trichonymphae]|jgi:hypothetical protein|nr:hypothetical protein [Candidatus Ancillula trichonymphae]